MLIAGRAAEGQIIKKDKIDWIFTIGLAQSAINNWKQGEVSGFEFSSSLNLKSSFRIDTFLLRLNLRYSAGVQYTEDANNDFQYFIPTDNLFAGETVLAYPLGWKLDPCVSAQFNTQLLDAFRFVKGRKFSTASLWDPVTSMQSFGFEFSTSEKSNYFTSHLGLSLKQIRAKEFTKQTDDFKTPNIKERYKHQTGIQWKSDAKFNLTKEVTYRGTMALFGSFDDFAKWTIAFTNQLDLKVFKAIGVIININLAYDERQMMKMQYTQNLRFGFIVSPK